MSKKRQISAKEFSRRFTDIVCEHLTTLAPQEQAKRIREAERQALKYCRGASSTASTTEKTPQTPLGSRSHAVQP